MSTSLRKWHHSLAPWLVLPILVTLLTGVTYRIGRAWFGMQKEVGNALMEIHTGEWLGDTASVFYVIVVGLGLLALIVTGATLLLKSKARLPERRFHRWVAWALMLPAAASALTGVAYHVGEAWFHIPDEAGDVLMAIHQGSWLGKALVPYYVLFVGLGLLFLIATGIKMLLPRSSKRPAA